VFDLYAVRFVIDPTLVCCCKVSCTALCECGSCLDRVLAIGVASVVGTLKFLTGISIKPFIAGSLLPTVGLACYMQW
jgi:hypothetical protein